VEENLIFYYCWVVVKLGEQEATHSATSLERKLVVRRYRTPQRVGSLMRLNLFESFCLIVCRSSEVLEFVPELLLDLLPAGAVLPKWWMSFPNLLESFSRIASTSTSFTRSTDLAFFTAVKSILRRS
jgi:hypothetical protein